MIVAEDEALVRMVAADRLTDEGFNVIEAEHAEGALIALRQGCVHLLFTDIHMPGTMSGLDLARLVRREWPGIALIVTSGAHSPGPGELPEGGAFFRKPYALDRLLAQVHTLMPR